jgi:hypothetical protein
MSSNYNASHNVIFSVSTVMYRLLWGNNSLHLFSRGAGFDSRLEYPLSFLRTLVISKSLTVNTQNSVPTCCTILFFFYYFSIGVLNSLCLLGIRKFNVYFPCNCIIFTKLSSNLLHYRYSATSWN